MPLNMEVIENGRIISINLVDPWTLDELLFLHEDAFDYFESVDHKVHSLFDWSHSHHTPANISKMRNTSPFFWHPNSEYIALVNPASDFLAVLQRLRPEDIRGGERFQLFESQGEAMSFLRQAITRQTSSFPIWRPDTQDRNQTNLSG